MAAQHRLDRASGPMASRQSGASERGRSREGQDSRPPQDSLAAAGCRGLCSGRLGCGGHRTVRDRLTWLRGPERPDPALHAGGAQALAALVQPARSLRVVRLASFRGEGDHVRPHANAGQRGDGPRENPDLAGGGCPSPLPSVRPDPLSLPSRGSARRRARSPAWPSDGLGFSAGSRSPARRPRCVAAGRGGATGSPIGAKPA